MAHDDIVSQHLARLKMATVSKLGRRDLATWIERNTFLGGKPYSFKDHLWQKRVLAEESNEIVLLKSAQLGASELSLRMAAAMIMTATGTFSIGYLFPTASFSMTYAKTRFGPIVSESPALRAAVASTDLDNAEVKSFGTGKNIMFRGCNSETSGLSHSLDAIYWDEYSFMNQAQAKIYESRLIASKYRIKVKLSTPTFENDPISTAFANSKRWFNFCKCHRCGHQFYPSFYEHCSVPGWDKHLDEINEENLHTTAYTQAALKCPSCGKVPSLLPEHRHWVCENPSDNFVATGFKVSPFDVPTIVTVPYLVQVSTQYQRKADFRNFNLGMTAEDTETGLTDLDMESIAVESASNPFTTCVMGFDLGLVCHIAVGGVGSDLRLGIVHYERVPLSKFRERYHAVRAMYRVSITVGDVQPYSDLVMSLSYEDPNLFGASYITRTGLELFDMKQREADVTEALGPLKQVNVNRNAIFDRLMTDVRDKRVWIKKTTDWQTLKAHALDMKRQQSALRNGEFTAQWVKSAKGNDHFWHSVAYLWIAAQMRGVAGSSSSITGPAVSTFKLKQLQTVQEQRRLQMSAMRR